MEMKKLVKLKREPKKGFGEAECPMCGKIFTLPAPQRYQMRRVPRHC